MTISKPNDALPTCKVAAIEAGDELGSASWRIDQIWGEGVGILGGPPKCAKSWFGLDMAASIASATPLLGHFSVRDPGPTVVYLAEDAHRQVRSRIAGICQHRGLDIAALDVHLITAPAVRLDHASDQRRLAATVQQLRPKLLLLDPLVRLHRLDENSSADISVLLGFLRELQRRYDVAIVVVHHMRKAVRAQLGQALRGSGDLHAWNDHGLYLTRTGSDGQRLRLTVEHRAAPAIEPLELRLASEPDGSAAHLELVGSAPCAEPNSSPAPLPPAPSLAERIINALRAADAPISRAQLRSALRVNNNRLGQVLAQLHSDGRVVRDDHGLSLPS